jgi:autophagy-related protein 17
MASPPPSESEESSVTSLETRDPTLEELVEMLLASKRSLSSINQIWRAREIVDACRDAVEENAVLTARNTFVRHAVSEQLGSLEAIRQGARVVELEGHQELKVRQDLRNNVTLV